MRLNVVLVLAAVVSTVSATPDTNAQRLARGLPPLPPVRRATRVAVAKKSRPSSSHDGCNTGSLYCCDSVNTFQDTDITSILSRLHGVTIPVNIPVGFTCSPLAFGNPTCSQQTVCCEDNEYNENGISVGCSPVDLGL